MTAADRARLLDEVVGLVRAAHVEILRVYARPVEAQFKEDQSPLTEADLASHRVLTEGLARLKGHYSPTMRLQIRVDPLSAGAPFGLGFGRSCHRVVLPAARPWSSSRQCRYSSGSRS